MTQPQVGRSAEQQGPVVLLDKYENGRIWVITMNRPQRMNSLGGGLPQALTEAWIAFRDDPDARVAILTGAGDRAFCAGADLIEAAARTQAAQSGEPARRRRPMAETTGLLLGCLPLAEGLQLWKPTIAAVNGYAIAGGFALAMQCDIRVAAEHARVGIAEARWNLPGAGWIAPLTRQIGLGIALELSLWADTQFTAQRAYEVGWVNKVVPKEQLMPTAMDYAQRMLDMAPREVRNIKQTLYRAFYMTPDVAMAFGNAVEQNLEGMQDSIEGPRSFAEKRRPNFTDS